MILSDTNYELVDMIRSFRHAGLKRFYERGDRRRLLAEHVPKIARVLAQLDIATDPDDMDLPGFHLHPLTGNLAGCRVLERHHSCQLADYFSLRCTWRRDRRLLCLL